MGLMEQMGAVEEIPARCGHGGKVRHGIERWCGRSDVFAVSVTTSKGGEGSWPSWF